MDRDAHEMPVAEGDMMPPRELPFLESISWFDARPRDLSQREMLARYEKGFRFVGVTADLDGEERAFVRALARRFGSELEGRV
ncbi:MAG TPA: hypothetical protein VHB21_22855 [Minicystis sp.]|nr:hypothetical protein [Minicystis sp.]